MRGVERDQHVEGPTRRALHDVAGCGGGVQIWSLGPGLGRPQAAEGKRLDRLAEGEDAHSALAGS